MEVSFDPEKDARNRRERGFSLAFGSDVIRNMVTTRIDKRHDYGEVRRIAYGYVEERLFVCVYTLREDTLRIISVRKANEREVRKYGRPARR
jgi:uncharacterized DUF497 family protein